MKAAKYGDLFRTPNPDNPAGYQASFKKVWSTTLRKAGVPYFRIYDLRSFYATRLSAGGVADEWVTQTLRQGDAQVMKKYSQMKLQMKREALEKLKTARPAKRLAYLPSECARSWSNEQFRRNKCTVNARSRPKTMNWSEQKIRNYFRMSSALYVGA